MLIKSILNKTKGKYFTQNNCLNVFTHITSPLLACPIFNNKNKLQKKIYFQLIHECLFVENKNISQKE